MILDSGNIFVFVRVVQAGSMSAASRLTGIPVATISGKIANLEQRLKTTLLIRNTRSLKLTDAGKLYYDYCVDAIQKIEIGESLIENYNQEPSGTLRLIAPRDVTRYILTDITHSYLQRYPKMKLEIISSDKSEDFYDENIDLGIRVGLPKDQSFKVKQLAEASGSIWATPEYLKKYKTPKTPRELKKHFYNKFSDDAQRKLGIGTEIKLTDYKSKKTFILDFPSRMEMNDFESLKNYTLLHTGISLLPDFICKKEYQSGELVRVLPGWKWKTFNIYFFYPLQKFSSPRIQSFINHCSEPKNKEMIQKLYIVD